MLHLPTMIKPVVSVVVLLLPMCVFSTTIDEYLLQANDRAYVKGLTSRAAGDDNWSSSWADKKEIRIQHEEDERNNSSETYRFRLRPKYGSEREAEHELYSVSTEQRWLYANNVLGEDLLRRYLNIIEVVSMQFDIHYLQDKLTLLQFGIDSGRASSQNKKFDAAKLQALILDLEHTTTQLALSKTHLNSVTSSLQLTLDDSVSANDLITPALILSTMKKYNDVFDNAQSVPLVRMAKLDKNMAGAKLKLQQSQQSFGVELLELKYQDKENSSVGFTLGFRLPDGNNAGSLQRYLEQSKADSKFRLTSDDVENALLKKRAEIDWQYSVWQADQAASEKIKKLLVQPSRRQTPVLITGLRRQQLAINKKRDAVHIAMLENYVDLLHITGLLGKHPLKNWLYAGLPELAHN